MKFNEILRDYLIENNLNQTELALKLKVRQSQISEWLKGKANPGYETLKSMTSALNVSADYLLGLENDFGAKVAAPMGEGNGYSSEECKLVEDYRALNSAGKKLVKQTVETLRATSAQSEQKINKN